MTDMTDDFLDDLPSPVWSGSFEVFGVEVKCHVLSSGERIIEQESVEALFNAMAHDSPDGVPDFPAGLAEFCGGKGIPHD